MTAIKFEVSVKTSRAMMLGFVILVGTSSASVRSNQNDDLTWTPGPTRLRVSPKVADKLLLEKVIAEYPPDAIKAHITGSIEFAVRISSKGRVIEAVVRSGQPTLVEPAKQALRKWRYKPYLLNGEPTVFETYVSVTFKLPKDK